MSHDAALQFAPLPFLKISSFWSTAPSVVIALPQALNCTKRSTEPHHTTTNALCSAPTPPALPRIRATSRGRLARFSLSTTSATIRPSPPSHHPPFLYLIHTSINPNSSFSLVSVIFFFPIALIFAIDCLCSCQTPSSYLVLRHLRPEFCRQSFSRVIHHHHHSVQQTNHQLRSPHGHDEIIAASTAPA
jgi:hypothetical protein